MTTSLKPTCRDLVAVDNPDHEWHTATELISVTKTAVDVLCSCGVDLRVPTKMTASRFSIEPKDVVALLSTRVPTPPKRI